jgi:hypothetical protein
VTGALDLSLASAGCDSAPVTGFLQVKGTWTAKSNGNYADDTITSGDEHFTLDSSCLVISSTPVTCDGAAGLLKSVGYSELTCPSTAGGGCACSGKVDQTGGIGVVSMSPSTSGPYKTSGNVVTISGDMGDMQYSYCVSGDKMTMTPLSTNPTMTGTIVLQKSGSSSSGGATGSGGQSGSGGKSGAGGATGSGGKSAAGGTAGSGAGGVAGSGGKSGAGGATGSGGTSAAGGTTGGSTGSKGPCDIYAAASNPCVAAHSTVRALFGAYSGKLYQVKRSSDNTTKDILTLSAGGIADTAPQDTFCGTSACSLMVVYDQSGKGNDLWYQGSEQVPASPQSSAPKMTDSVTVGGHKVYSVFIKPGNCMWHDGSKSGMPTGSQPEGLYMVSSARNTNGGCCYDYGNSETTRSADVGGAMDSINVSSITAWGTGAGKGPWIMADMEWGVFCQADNKNNPNNPTQTAPFLTAILKNNGTTEYALRGGDATTGALATYYKGRGPYNPMMKQGAIILGCGGDCCKPSGGANASSGIFFEGAIVTGYPTDATEDAVQTNIVAAGYGK